MRVNKQFNSYIWTEVLLDNSTKNLNNVNFFKACSQIWKIGRDSRLRLMEYWQKSAAQKQLVSQSKWCDVMSEVCVLVNLWTIIICLSLICFSRTQKRLQIHLMYVYKQYIPSAHGRSSIRLYIRQSNVKMAFISLFWLEGGLEWLPGLLGFSGVAQSSVYAVKLWVSETLKHLKAEHDIRQYLNQKHFGRTYKWVSLR